MEPHALLCYTSYFRTWYSPVSSNLFGEFVKKYNASAGYIFFPILYIFPESVMAYKFPSFPLCTSLKRSPSLSTISSSLTPLSTASSLLFLLVHLYHVLLRYLTFVLHQLLYLLPVLYALYDCRLSMLKINRFSIRIFLRYKT